MSDPHLFTKRSRVEGDPARLEAEAVAAGGAADVIDLPVASDDDLDVIEPRRATTRSKLAEGARGIKLAIRAESSFFAHAYRGLLIAITAVILGVSATGWCFLIVSAALVLLAETFRCAIDTVLAAVAMTGDPTARAAREIAAGGLLFASITSAGLTLMVLVSRLGELLGW